MPKQSKAIDMHFYWLRDWSNRGQFNLYWKKGYTDKAGYFTKHHPAFYHHKIRILYMAS